MSVVFVGEKHYNKVRRTVKATGLTAVSNPAASIAPTAAPAASAPTVAVAAATVAAASNTPHHPKHFLYEFLGGILITNSSHINNQKKIKKPK